MPWIRSEQKLPQQGDNLNELTVKTECSCLVEREGFMLSMGPMFKPWLVSTLRSMSLLVPSPLSKETEV